MWLGRKKADLGFVRNVIEFFRYRRQSEREIVLIQLSPVSTYFFLCRSGFKFWGFYWLRGQYSATNSYPLNLAQDKATGGDADVPCLKGNLQFYSARETCGCWKTTSRRCMGRSRLFQQETFLAGGEVFHVAAAPESGVGREGVRSLSFHSHQMWLTCLLWPSCSCIWITQTWHVMCKTKRQFTESQDGGDWKGPLGII